MSASTSVAPAFNVSYGCPFAPLSDAAGARRAGPVLRADRPRRDRLELVELLRESERRKAESGKKGDKGDLHGGDSIGLQTSDYRLQTNQALTQRQQQQ